jgi:flagellar export protein FliJ
VSVLRRLARYHRYLLDERRRALRTLEEQAAAIEGAIEGLDQGIVTEQRIARSAPEVIGAYGGFARAALERRSVLLGSLSEASDAVDAARDELLDAFSEVKRYEISLEHQERREHEERGRQLQGQIDEAALNLHRRRDRG